jgi:hypothetical protein
LPVRASSKRRIEPIFGRSRARWPAAIFPTLQSTHGRGICSGEQVEVNHEHFFASSAYFGSLDENGNVEQAGTATRRPAM